MSSTNDPTTRETADHAELARRLHAVIVDPSGICAEAADALDTLLSEITALRGERDRWHSAYEVAHDQATANGSSSRQAERQRDEAMAVLIDIRDVPYTEQEWPRSRALNFIANQGADQ